MKSDPPEGATPLDPDETEGLLAGHITTLGELNELEDANIQLGQDWALRAALFARRKADVLTEDFLFELHRRMFGEVWQWAGQVRKSNKNLGIDKTEVRPQLRNLVEDARLWRSQSTYSIDEQAVRFHHRLVAIHPFPNGNGRHARMMADLMAMQSGQRRFSWGSGSLTTTSDLRSRYVAALRAADRGSLQPLMEFARS